MKSNTEFNRLKLKTDQLYLPLSGGKVNGETIFTDKVIFGSGSKLITIHNGKIEGLPGGHTYDLESSSDKAEVTLTEDEEDKTTLPLVATFVGTRAEWNALSAADKAKYRIVHFTDDGGSDDISEEHITFTSSDTTDANATSWTGVTTLSSGLSLKTLFSRVSQMFKNIRYLYNSRTPVTLWTGEQGSYSGSVANISFPLSQSYKNFKLLRFYLIVSANAAGTGTRPILREVSSEHLDYVRSNVGTVSMCWGYGSQNDYCDIQPTSTDQNLVISVYAIKVFKIEGLYQKEEVGSDYFDGFLGQKVVSLYSGDGISGYAYKDFTINFSNTNGYTPLAVKEITSNNGGFSFCVRYLGNGSVVIRAFNCTANVAYPGTMALTILFARGNLTSL